MHRHTGLNRIIQAWDNLGVATILAWWQPKKNGSQLDKLLIAEILDPLIIEDKIEVGSRIVTDHIGFR